MGEHTESIWWMRQNVKDSGLGYYHIPACDMTNNVEVRMFFTEQLLADLEDDVFPQIKTATSFPGAELVVITPDAHVGYGVPVGCAIISSESGAVALGPVGFDIGCGMVSMSSTVDAEAATPAKRAAFNRAVTKRVNTGAGGRGVYRLSNVDRPEFQNLLRGGADYYVGKHGSRIDRHRAERNVIPVRDGWNLPSGKMDRGMSQLGSLGGGNHFIELQRSEQTNSLFVQVHTGSRGFGHGLADYYFGIAKAAQPDVIKNLDEAWFAPDDPKKLDYLDAVAAGGNYAIINRLIIAEEVSVAFESVFGTKLDLVYEISHNLVQREWWEGQYRNVHRKGATRAFPAFHPQLAGTPWYEVGHPVLIPGSNRDYSYILRPEAGAAASGYTVNHGAGRKMSRSAAKRNLDQATVNAEYAADGILVNNDNNVPLDESAAAYKSSEEVVAAVTRAGLARVEHKLWPLASVKGA